MNEDGKFLDIVQDSRKVVLLYKLINEAGENNALGDLYQKQG